MGRRNEACVRRTLAQAAEAHRVSYLVRAQCAGVVVEARPALTRHTAEVPPQIRQIRTGGRHALISTRSSGRARSATQIVRGEDAAAAGA